MTKFVKLGLEVKSAPCLRIKISIDETIEKVVQWRQMAREHVVETIARSG